MQKKFDEQTAKQIKLMAGELNKHEAFKGDKKIVIKYDTLLLLLGLNRFQVKKQYGYSPYYEILLTPKDIQKGTYDTDNIKSHLLPRGDE